MSESLAAASTSTESGVPSGSLTSRAWAASGASRARVPNERLNDMDSTGLDDYAGTMKRTMTAARRGIRAYTALLGLSIYLLLGAAATSAAEESDTPTLLVLQHVQGNQTVDVAVPLVPGAHASPQRGRPQERWRILPGQSFASEARPPDRAVHFYQGAAAPYSLLCIVHVRYYRDAGGRWVPHFQLYEEPLVVPNNGRWQPFTTARGTPLLLVLTGNALPNAEGFFAALEFGFSAGAVSIDAWMVR